jgi:hypothetical protein
MVNIVFMRAKSAERWRAKRGHGRRSKQATVAQKGWDEGWDESAYH